MRVKEYVDASYTVISGGTQTDTVLERLKHALERRGLLNFYPKILRGLVEKIEQSQSADCVSVALARESDKKRYDDSITSAITELDGDVSKLQIKIDTTIIGGFVATGNGKRIDRSFKSKLLGVYQKVAE